ncbi:hypothetical protein [Halomonas sp. HG01]|uniref:hypothetical protein n=1 Tax=Halomonas sp. HG01 TaxID=1609967 RepID=UPI000614599E|nr:hypothetical protein [Halomonas sp. HG01]
MRKLLQTISIAMLVLTVLFPVLYLVDAMGETAMKWAMLVVTVVWFAVTPLWMGREDHAAAAGAPTAE